MYLCLCHGISDSYVREYITNNKKATLKDFQKRCSAGKNCGTCLCEIRKFLEKNRKKIKTK